MLNAGDIIRYRRVDPVASSKADHRGGVWVYDMGVVLVAHHRGEGQDYLARIHFPQTGHTKTILSRNFARFGEVVCRA